MPLAVVTGASAGLGVEFAKLAAQGGYEPVLIARRKDRLEAVASQIQKATGQKCWVIDADLQAAGAARGIWKRIEAIGQPVEALVNNAGFGSKGKFTDLPIHREIEMIQLNVTALVELTAFALHGMRQRKKGYVLNVGSTAGFLPGPYMATYYATKNFVNAWSEALHTEMKPDGVLVSVLAPGATATEFAQVANMEKSRLFAASQASASDVARAGWRGMKQGRAVIVPGLLNQMMMFSLRITPKFMIRWIASFLNRDV
jgi:short-subunit dehydrogenase